MEPLLDVALDVALRPVGVVGGELGDEVVGVRHRGDAVADGELALQRLPGRVLLDAEELAEVEPGLVDVVVVVLDDAGTLPGAAALSGPYTLRPASRRSRPPAGARRDREMRTGRVAQAGGRTQASGFCRVGRDACVRWRALTITRMYSKYDT